MNRQLQWFNLLGVLLLAALCVSQWGRNRRLNLEVNDLEKTSQSQRKQISELDDAKRGLSEDLAHLKEQFKVEHDDLDKTRRDLREAETQIPLLKEERERLSRSIVNWSNAVVERDGIVKEANARIQELSTNLNASIEKYNRLVTNYNAVVKDLNEYRAGAGSASTNKP